MIHCLCSKTSMGLQRVIQLSKRFFLEFFVDLVFPWFQFKIKKHFMLSMSTSYYVGVENGQMTLHVMAT